MARTKKRGVKKSGPRPLGDRVLVKPVADEKKTASGIIIPDTVDKGRPERGRVVAVGEGRISDEGKLIPPRVKVGDVILFSKYSPDEVKLDGEDYLVIRESDISMILN